MDKPSPCFVWIDLEMTGLDPETCAIVEIGVIITGPDLAPLAELERVIWQPPEVLARMEPFVREMHTRNGLLERIRTSPTSLRDAERDVTSLISAHCGFREGVLAGNSIHQDRRFLCRYMPLVEGFLHYRQVDVSSLKVLAKAWYPELEFKKDSKTHTALDDIRGSLAELAFYREHLLAPRRLGSSDA
jgi:oligoribonuclease